jgi:cytochrome b pre-mRNA-processing protein 3
VILNLFRPKAIDPADTLYLAVVAKARVPAFYLDAHVPDTVEGRFEMILLHLALVFHRVRNEDEAAKRIAQRVVEAFFTDMDRSLREMGIGDVSVPKKMKKLGQAYNGRSMAYIKALDADDAEALAAAICRNVMACEPGTETAEALEGSAAIADYALATMTRLASRPVAELLAGEIAVAPVPSAHVARPHSQSEMTGDAE